jgi:hypothetical protein
MRRPNSAACATSFISSTNTVSPLIAPDVNMPTRARPFSTPGASPPSSRRPVNSLGRASFLWRPAVPEPISGRERRSRSDSRWGSAGNRHADFLPCPLQRIPDLRTGKLLLTWSLEGWSAYRHREGLPVVLMAPSPNEADQKLLRNALVALVVGSVVGSGIFALPASFGRAAGAISI